MRISSVFAGASVLALAVCLSACAPDLTALAKDPATGSLHINATYPGAQITVDYTRVNTTGTAASASAANGTTVNVPLGAVVNPAPATGSTTTTNSTVPTSPPAGVTIPSPSATPTSSAAAPPKTASADQASMAARIAALMGQH